MHHKAPRTRIEFSTPEPLDLMFYLCKSGMFPHL